MLSKRNYGKYEQHSTSQHSTTQHNTTEKTRQDKTLILCSTPNHTRTQHIRYYTQQKK